MQDVRIDDALRDLGLGGDAAARARAALVEAGLTNARKERIAVAKLDRLRAAVDERFARFCAPCASRTDAGGREVVIVPPQACARCGGSDNHRALEELAEACARTGVRRLVVVGGSPDTRRELRALRGVDVRLVDGTARRTKPDAQNDLEWADVAVVCGGTELAHKVSNLYTGPKVVTSQRRGVTAIAGEVTRHLELRSARGRR